MSRTVWFFFSSRRRHTRCALVTGVQTCALPIYGASTNMLWPWSYDQCERKQQKAQEISGCAVTHHYELNRRQGRGATEIDIMEVLAEIGRAACRERVCQSV